MAVYFKCILFTGILIYFTSLCASENAKKSLDDNRDDVSDGSDESLEIATEIEAVNSPSSPSCATRRQNSIVHEISKADIKEFPFMAAIFSQQNEFVCSGVVVSNGLIITAASCLMISPSYVLLNAATDKKDNKTVTLHINRVEKFPTYIPGTNSKDVGLIFTDKHNGTVASKVKLSNYTNFHDIPEFTAFGYGLNVDIGANKELQYVGLENRVQPERGEEISGYLDCIETKVSSCFKDKGGPALFDNELIGIVFKGQDICTREMTSTFAVHKSMVSVLPSYTFRGWLDERMKKNDQQSQADLSTYPVKPVSRQTKPKPSSQRSYGGKIMVSIFVEFISLFSCITMS